MTLKLEPESFDAIILLGTASNMQDLPSALNKIRGLLKHNGFVLFNFPHADSLIARVYGLRYWMYAPSVSNFTTVAGCLKMLEQAQFTPASILTDTQQHSLGKLLHHSKLDRFISRRFESWTNRPIPFAVPIPAVTLVRATKNNNTMNTQS